MTVCMARVTRDTRCGVELRLIEPEGWWGHVGPHARHYPRPASRAEQDTSVSPASARPAQRPASGALEDPGAG